MCLAGLIMFHLYFCTFSECQKATKWNQQSVKQWTQLRSKRSKDKLTQRGWQKIDTFPIHLKTSQEASSKWKHNYSTRWKQLEPLPWKLAPSIIGINWKPVSKIYQKSIRVWLRLYDLDQYCVYASLYNAFL